MKIIFVACILMFSIILTACSTKPLKSATTSPSYLLVPAVIVDTNDGINKQEAVGIIGKIGDLYKIPEVKILNNFRLIRNYWVAETYTVNKSKPKQFWLNNKTGSLTRGYKKNISLKNLVEKSPKIKELKKGVFQLTPSISVSPNDGINKNEAQMILQMYRLVSIGTKTVYYTPVVSEGRYWVSKKIGHWGYKTMKHPVKINNKSGDITHGSTHYKLSHLYSEFKKVGKKYYGNSITH
jgi:hypothetical protein